MSSVRISIYVQPRASKTGVVGMHGDAWKEKQGTAMRLIGHA
jgi:hypothetical protein